MKTTKEKIEVMKAYAEGKKIESTSQSVIDWIGNPMPQWNWERCDYRVKPEPKYRPFKNIDELVSFWEAHYCNSNRPKETMPLIWVKSDELRYLITSFNTFDDTVYTSANISLEHLFENYTFLDGRPCGVEE